MSEKDFNKLFAKNLSNHLSYNNMTQVELANRLQVSTATISNWCKGIKLPRMDKVDKICAILNIKRSDLLEEKDLTIRDKKEIAEILSHTEELLRQEGLMFDGEPASPESIESILSAMKIGMEMAKQNNKKYTPRKYKKD